MSDSARLQREIELHEDIADDYRDRYGHPFSAFYNHYWNDRIIRLIPKDKNLRVLDLGCGTGFLLSDLVGSFPNVTGLDLSQAMLGVAQEKEAIRHCLVAGDGSKLPFRDSCFDVVLCRGSLHHLPNLNAAFSEMNRVLSPGGYIAFSEPSNGAWLIRMARKIMYHLSEKFDEEDEGYRIDELAQIVSSNGFKVMQMRYVGLLGYTFAGFPDRLGLLKYVPGSLALTRLFVALDEIVERIPGLNTQCFQIVGLAQKKASRSS